MDVNRVLDEYDNMFGKHSLEEIEAFLTEKVREAETEPDEFSELTLLNEMVGFYRDTSQMEKGLDCCKKTMELSEQLGLQGTVEYATSLLNVANAYRAFGRYQESLSLHQQVYDIYKKKLPERDFSFASLFNNWSLLYQEMGEFEDAAEMLKKAMAVVDTYPEAVMQQATTRSNLAATLLRLSQMKPQADAIYQEAMQYLQEALEIYEKDGGRDFHYSAALSAMGDACYLKARYEEAAEYYRRALQELEKHVGKTEAYHRVEENYRLACKKAAEGKEQSGAGFQTNLERCRAFYVEYGKPFLQEKFGAYEKRIAVGLVGEGSDCFGFDDAVSMDHDYGIGFCMWLIKEDYDKIGEKLEQEYETLLSDSAEEFLKRHGEENIQFSKQMFLDKRRGVFEIEAFYETLLDAPLSSWETQPEDKLAATINGEVFRDESGVFTGIRKKIEEYYSDNVWRMRLAQELHYFSQYAQSNYTRMMARKDVVTAAVCVGKGLESAMKIAYLLNRQYAPYYKWMRKGLERCDRLQELLPVIDELAVTGSQADVWKTISYRPDVIYTEDRIVFLFEKAADIILKELNRQNLVEIKTTFLEQYCGELISRTGGKRAMTREELIDAIVLHEWQQFDKVKNEGGRADCQDDWNTFSIMRKSQYRTWPDELLVSYYDDLLKAEEKGWNLIMEKYARMMESTAWEQYQELKKDLPERSEKRLAIQEEIIKIQVGWMEEFAKKYPKLAGNARSIHTSEDSAYNTSYETYLRGELGTYSEQTLLLYGKFIADIAGQSGNLAAMIMEETVHLYGYASMEEAEQKM